MQNNLLLNRIGRKDRHHLIAACDEVELCIDDILWEPQERIRQVYFPLDGFISQLVRIDGHENLELALVGNEGMLGLPLVLGVNESNFQALVQGPGVALRLSAASFRRELVRMPALRSQLLRYAYVVEKQIAITAACISFHSIDLRLARWLLMSHDRADFGGFHLTHKFLAQMLGVRRVGVTNAASELQRRDLVSYSRGSIEVLDRAGLEKASCPCYRESLDVYQRVLG